jgi:hypothetical protein
MNEDAVIQSQRTVELVADRIERAYLRRYPDCQGFGLDGRIWWVAAGALLEAQRRLGWLPLDPELFVASQSHRLGSADPWSDLVPAEAIARYQERVTAIVRGLRRELRAELRRVQREVERGHSLEWVLRGRRRWLSPLGRYIAAYQSERTDLVDRFRSRARHQHEACPLYRHACLTFLPEWAYPVIELVPGYSMTPRSTPAMRSICMN